MVIFFILFEDGSIANPVDSHFAKAINRKHKEKSIISTDYYKKIRVHVHSEKVPIFFFFFIIQSLHFFIRTTLKNHPEQPIMGWMKTMSNRLRENFYFASISYLLSFKSWKLPSTERSCWLRLYRVNFRNFLTSSSWLLFKPRPL